MAIVKKVAQGWIIVSENSGIPLVNRVFHSRSAAQNYASKFSPNMY
jgi:hypothetical protein